MFRALFLLASLAIISSMMMPFGYMPAKADDGTFILRICDGIARAATETPDRVVHGKTDHAQMEHAQMDHGTMASSPADHDEAAHESRCNYATTVAANLPDIPQIVHCEQVVHTPLSRNLAVLTAIYPPNLPPATGPPAK